MATFATDQMQLVFNEDFDRAQLAGGSTLWNTTMPGGYGNVGSTGEKQLYLDDNSTTLSNGTVLNIDPFTFADGVMTITANPTPAEQLTAALNYKWTSGRHQQLSGVRVPLRLHGDQGSGARGQGIVASLLASMGG